MSTESIAAIAALVRSAQRILFVTGAGISADSGVPTYRGVGGLYDDAHTDEGIPIEVALSGSMFRSRPEVTWKYISQIEAACRGAEPNAAHRAIAAIAADRDVWVLTQNVDGLHRAAGSRQVIEIHGDVHDLACTACRYATRVADFTALPPLPRCPDCDAVVRPRVVLFEELLPLQAVAALERELERGFDLYVSIGTSALFPYIVEPFDRARRGGKPSVEINPDTTELSRGVTHHLRMRAAEAMTAIERAMSRGG